VLAQQTPTPLETPEPPEPRWPALAAMLAFAGLRYALPSSLTWGPDWTMVIVIPVLMIPVILTRRAGYHHGNDVFGYVVLTAVTSDLLASLVLLISRLPSHSESPKQLLIAAGGLWFSNIIVFASWYWRLDAGGPNKRDARGHHDRGAFLFPQMTLKHSQAWRPKFLDYLFLAFNTSTAFSPTDVPVLSRWAKGMMMLQSSISLTTIAILAARAVNVL
jgi:uncharacterized membrane protein